MIFVTIQCDNCGTQIKGNKAITNKTDIIRMARYRGWTVGKWHTCPACQKQTKEG